MGVGGVSQRLYYLVQDFKFIRYVAAPVIDGVVIVFCNTICLSRNVSIIEDSIFVFSIPHNLK